MPTPLWRAFALIAIALTLTLTVGDLVHLTDAGTLGYTSEPTVASLQKRVTAVEPGSAAAKAGVVVGDLIAPVQTLANAATYSFPPAPGFPVAVEIARGDERKTVTLMPTAQQRSNGTNAVGAAYEILRLVMLGVAFLIVLRSPTRSDARALATFYIAFAFGFIVRPPWYPTAVLVAIFVFGPLAVFFSLTQALRFSTIFPRPSGRGPRLLLQHCVPYLFAVAVVLTLVSTLAPPRYVGSTLLVSGVLFVSDVLFVITLAGIVAAFALAFREATDVDRPRLRWVMVSLIVGLAGLIPTVALEQAGVDAWWRPLFALSLVVIPIGTAYAILRHRLLDVGFVISRALVFTILSTIVVLAFTALEWLLSKYVVAAGHVQSAILEAALAVLLGLSMQRLHARVDRTVDHVFFRERYRAERALRRFAQECAFIDDPQILAQRTLEVLERAVHPESVGLYTRDREGAYVVRAAFGATVPQIDQNAPCITAMRAFHEPVQIERDGTLAAGATAFPMLVRGELTGLFALGIRASGEAYDPDERAELQNVAASLAAAFDSLEVAELKRAVDRALSGELSLDALRKVRFEIP